MLEFLQTQVNRRRASGTASNSEEDHVRLVVLRASVLMEMEKLEEAMHCLNEAKEMNNKLGNQEMQAQILENFALLYLRTGKYDDAIKAVKGSIAIFSRLSGNIAKLGHGNGLTILGSIYSVLGNYLEATLYEEQSVEVLLKTELSKNEPLLGVAYGNLGLTRGRMGEYDKAIELCNKALEVSRNSKNKFEEAKSLHNIGNAYCGKGEYQKSITFCTKSAKIFREIGKKIQESISYGVLALGYSGLRERKTSECYFRHCIEINRDFKQLFNLAIVYGNRGLHDCEHAFSKFLAFKNADKLFESSLRHFKLAIESTDAVLGGLSVDINMTAFADQFYRWHDHLTKPLILLGRSTAALLVLDVGRAKILRHLLHWLQAKKQGDPLQSCSKSISESLWMSIENGEERRRRILSLTQEIHLVQSKATVLFYSFNRALILTIWVLNANGCVALKTSDPFPFFSRNSERNLECLINTLLKQASGCLPRGYSFYQHSKEVYCKIVSDHGSASKGTAFKKNAKECCPILNAVEANLLDDQDMCRSPAERADDKCNNITKVARSLLHKALIGPVMGLIQGSSKLIIVPHKCIFFAPFSSLIDQDGCLLSEKYQIQIIPSIHVLEASMQSSKEKVGGSLFVGNPKVDENFLLQPLPSAAREVEYLAAIFDTKPLTEHLATKRKVMQQMTNMSIIHIAAHGHEQNGQIFLAPQIVKSSNTAQLSSSCDILTQTDVLECGLSARLVVLSCCHTGQGQVSSEGVLGIARSFLGAGAKSVLISLWAINDHFTLEFMKVFYGKICEGKPVCLALKESMNTFQRSGPYQSFLYWGAFEILGEDVSFSKNEIEEIRRKNKET